MIHTKFYCTQPEGSIHMVMKGHADAAPKGRDLVCAGASTLACTLAEAVERMYHQGMLRRCPKAELGSGRAEIIAVPKREFFHEALMVFWMAELGVGLLERTYPRNVGVEETLRTGWDGEGQRVNE